MDGPSAPSGSAAPVLLAEVMVDRDNGAGTDAATASDAASNGAGDKRPGVGYQPPQGAWKDGLCAWRNQLAPSCIIATFFPVFTLSLLSQRVGWSFKKQPLDGCCCPSTPDSHFRRTQQRLRLSVFITCAFALTVICVSLNLDSKLAYVQLGIFITLIVLQHLEAPVTILARIRQKARERLQLPPLCGSAREGDRVAFMGDFCVSCFCPRLVAAQLLRHLFDFRGRSDPRWPAGLEDVETLV